MDPETPEADAVEQSLRAEDDHDPELASAGDADPADVADQQRSEPGDDSYERG